MKLMQAIGGAGNGGAENFFIQLASAFHTAGMDQHLVTRAHEMRDAKLKQVGISHQSLKFGGALDFITPLRLKTISKTYKPDIYLSWMSRAASMTPAGPFPKLARLGGYYNPKYFKKCDHLVGITPDLCRHVIDQGWPQEKVHYVPNFLNWKPTPPVKRADFNTPEDVPLLLALGRLHPIKGLDIAIQSLTQIRDAHLWLAGDGPLRKSLEELAISCGVADRVRFLGWRTDKEALLATADITVFPSRQEGFGNVILEAWAARTPIVATRAEGPAAYINHGETGMLAPIDDIDTFAAQINVLIETPDLHQKIARCGHQQYESRFTEQIAIRNWQMLFQKLT
ncbi:MAG: glycosyltransferase [Sneathiella sp.]|nr:glycosyltransferase [Sneathiella sp.]